VPFERLMRAFPEVSRTSAVQDGSASGLQIDLGQQAMDRAMAEADIMAGNNWHHNVVRLVASYVSRGLTDAEIHALTDRFTMAGYTIEDTRLEVQTAIDGARAKGYAPTPDPITERMAAQAVQAATIRISSSKPGLPQCKSIQSRLYCRVVAGSTTTCTSGRT
jgi:hypothetical protein